MIRLLAYALKRGQYPENWTMPRLRNFLSTIVLLISNLWCFSNVAAQGRQPGWALDQFCYPGIDGTAYASCVYDDGTGEALYVGGEFDIAGCQMGLGNIVKWDGHTWSPLTGASGTGVDGIVHAMAVYDDGSGPALYVGGEFTTAGGSAVNKIAKWDGSEWTALSGSSGAVVEGFVYAMTAYDDGSGPALYVGGSFTAAGSVTANSVASWDGSEWSALGNGSSNGISNTVRSLTSYDDGSGSRLYAAGRFDTAGGITVNNVAAWDGTNWSGLTNGNGLGVSSEVFALTVFDDGTGPVLVLGGEFRKAGSITAEKIATWNGSQWETLNGTGDLFQPFDNPRADIFALTVLQNNKGDSELYAGGDFPVVDGSSSRSVLRWDGTDWSLLDETYSRDMYGTVCTLNTASSMGLTGVYAGGSFIPINDSAFTTNSVSVWDGSSWSGLFDEAGQTGLNRPSDELSVYDDGHESSLFVTGDFSSAGVGAALGIARLSESGFSTPPGDGGSGLYGSSIDILSEGEGAGMYVFGYLSEKYGGTGRNIYRYDGAVWSATDPDPGPLISDMQVTSKIVSHDDGVGPSVYIYGRCGNGRCEWEYLVAKWDGQEWVPLVGASGLSFNGRINAVTFFDDGTGQALYAGGFFTQVGGVQANYIAKWNGTDWEAVVDSNGQGLDGGVKCLTTFDDGTGPVLLAGGGITTAGGSPASQLAKWDGSEWSPLAKKPVQNLDGAVSAIYIDETNPSGPVVYVGGYFTTIGDMTVNHVAKWDGKWSALSGPNGIGVDGPVLDLDIYDDGNGPALYVAGDFRSAGGGVSSYIAKYNLCSSSDCPADTNNDGVLSPTDFTAWINAFNNDLSECDQNSDGSCTPTDFTAWVNNYTIGCAE